MYTGVCVRWGMGGGQGLQGGMWAPPSQDKQRSDRNMIKLSKEQEIHCGCEFSIFCSD